MNNQLWNQGAAARLPDGSVGALHGGMVNNEDAATAKRRRLTEKTANYERVSNMEPMAAQHENDLWLPQGKVLVVREKRTKHILVVAIHSQ